MVTIGFVSLRDFKRVSMYKHTLLGEGSFLCLVESADC